MGGGLRFREIRDHMRETKVRIHKNICDISYAIVDRECPREGCNKRLLKKKVKKFFCCVQDTGCCDDCGEQIYYCGDHGAKATSMCLICLEKIAIFERAKHILDDLIK